MLLPSWLARLGLVGAGLVLLGTFARLPSLGPASAQVFAPAATPSPPNCGGIDCPRGPVTRVRPGLLVVLSPRRTQLLSDRPALRWTEIAGATGYRVSLYAAGEVDPLWKIQTTQTGVSYPGDRPALEPGKFYRLSLQAMGTQNYSLEEPLAGGIDFQVLPVKEREAWRDKLAKIAQTERSPEAAALAAAKVLQEGQLLAEAIDRLEALGPAAGQSTAVKAMLVDLYRQAGLEFPDP